ncbi:phage tail tape measure protein [Microbacterium panaciterrae]|uniref:Phage tail tape measure protein domain-containing protein n=1 Tax=Microbacterium panaciterrae TaxID=985759 RepID=A0ABP8P7J2_9MICO
MADNVNENVLRLVVQGQADLEKVVALVRQLEQETGTSSQAMNKALGGVSTSFKELAGVANTTKTAVAIPAGSTASWDTLKAKVLEAAGAYRTLNQARLASGQTPVSAQQFLASPANTKSVSQADLNAFQQGSNISLLDAASQGAIQSLPRLRYALYDVAQTATYTGIAMTGLSIAVGAVSIKMDRQFADVVRTTGTYMDTTGHQTEALRAQFDNLFSQIPTSWGDLTQIGALAGQLGIANQDVAEFTKLVAQFAATTNVTVDQAGTAFGRLAALLDIPSAKFQNFGSAVLRVGVNSVATESQILSLSTQIAPMARVAGFTADQVVGLSGALASLGVQPELARGTVTRLFTNIATSVANGGTKLDAFARLSNESAAQFSQSWGTDASGALQTLLNSIGNLDQSQAIQALQDIGVKSARDIPTMLRLAQNTDLLAKALKDAKGGWDSGADVAQHYNVITSTIAEKIRILVNNFQLLIEHVGKSTSVLGGFVDGLIGLVGWLQKLVDNPFSATIAGILLTITLLGGVTLIAVGGMARFAASLFAVRTAATEMGISTTASALSVNTLTTALLGAEAAAGGAGKTVAALGIGLRFLGVAAIAMIAVPLVDQLHSWALEADGASVNADRLAKALNGVASGSTSKQDLADINAQIKAIGKSTADGLAATTSSGAPRAGRITTGIQNDLNSAGKQLDAGLASLGKKQADFAFANDWLNPTINQLQKFAQAYADAWSKASTATQQQAVLDSFDQLKERAKDAALAGGQSARDFEEGWRVNMAPAIAAIGTGVNAQKLLAEQSKQTADDISNAIKDILDAQESVLAVQNSVYSLGSALGENGAQWSVYSEAGRANMGALMAVVKAIAADTPGDSQTIASNLQALFNTIVQGGYASANQLSFLQDMITSLAGGKTVQPAVQDFSSFFAGIDTGAQKAQDKLDQMAKAAQKSAQEAVKEVRTLIDYANDLGGVFSRAFDIRFGGQQGLDSIASGWAKIKQQIADADQKLSDLYSKQSQLAASKSTKEYQLGIAQTYGDAKQAAQLRADIGDINTQMAANQQEIIKAQDMMTASLQGNSAAAIQNRSDILSLVQSYDSYVKTLAASGLSQDELKVRVAQLKQEFIAQATQMGFSGQEIDVYANHFDDLITVINNIPPANVSVSGLGPAEAALREFFARAKQQIANTPLDVPVHVQAPDYGKLSRGQALTAQIAALQALMLPHAGTDSQVSRNYDLLARIQALSSQLSSGNYSDGGYTGAGAPLDIAGNVHRDEYVMSKPAVNFFGVGFMDRLHMAGKNGSFAGFSGASDGGRWNPADIDTLARAIAYYSPSLQIGSEAIGNAARAANITANSLGRY